MKSTFYIGSYTQEGTPAKKPKGQGIGCFSFNLETGQVDLLYYVAQRNPSYIVISENKKYLYALEEMEEHLSPKVFAYSIDTSGRLTYINAQKLKGDYACHLAIVEGHLIVANYMSGNAVVFPIQKNGCIASHHQMIQHIGKGINKERQEAAHMHMVCPYKKGYMFLVDLSLDKANAYQLENGTKTWNAVPKLDITIESGAGARHMVFDASKTYAFVLSELTATIFVLKKEATVFKQRQKIAALPPNYKGSFGAAAIRLHPTGKFLYASIRGADTIAIFSVDKKNKNLTCLGFQATLGNTPRDFNIHSSGDWLIVANQDSDTIVVFKINQETGMLVQKSVKCVKTPVNITWLD